MFEVDEPVKSQEFAIFVIPAKLVPGLIR